MPISKKVTKLDEIFLYINIWLPLVYLNWDSGNFLLWSNWDHCTDITQLKIKPVSFSLFLKKERKEEGKNNYQQYRKVPKRIKN